jgi:uncharacterized protein DUF2000
MFDTKIAVIIRDDLLSWRALNVTAFLVTGIVGQFPGIIGEFHLRIVTFYLLHANKLSHGSRYEFFCMHDVTAPCLEFGLA